MRYGPEAGIYAIGIEPTTTILLGGQFRSDCADTLQTVTGDIDGALCSVLRFDHGDPGAVGLEEAPCLVDRHVVCPHFLDILYLLAGEGHQVLVDGDVNFAFNLVGIGPEKFEIGNETAGDGVLDRHRSRSRSAFGQSFEQAFESRAFDYVDFFPPAGVEVPCRLFMEASPESLDCRCRHLSCSKKCCPDIARTAIKVFLVILVRTIVRSLTCCGKRNKNRKKKIVLQSSSPQK